MRFDKLTVSLAIVFVCALAAAGLIWQGSAYADGSGCPSDWPEQSSDGSGGGQIDFDGFYTDGDGDEWYIIRSTDSNGATSVRAYPADDSYDAGYRSGSADEVCYLLIRGAGDSEDTAEPTKLSFQREPDEPTQTSARTPSTGGGSGGGTGGGGGTTGGQTNVAATLAAALEILRHSSALVAADLPEMRTDFPRYDQMVAGRKAALSGQLSILDDSGNDARVAQIGALVNRLQSNVDGIRAQRPELLRALVTEDMSRNDLTRANRDNLYPNANESVDEQFYSLVTSADAGSSGDVSKDNVLRYTHITSLSYNAILGHTFLLIASLMQDPTFVARIQESYDSVADRIERDIEYLQEGADAQLEQMILHNARRALAAGAGPGNYFVRLEQRLTLVAAERELVEDNEETLARLRDEIGRLAADVLGRQHPTPETTPEAEVTNPGVTASTVTFGQSADFSSEGTSELGKGMRLGIKAAFQEAGAIDGRTLELVDRDDGYEPERAFENTQELIGDEQVFALIGAVGTPTSRAVSPLAHAEGVPFIAPFTGAALLREPRLTNVLNLRASYHEETTAMVDYLEDQGVTSVAVLYQNDSYGIDGLTGVEQTLNGRDMELAASWYYLRHTASVRSAVYRIAAADPQAVIIIGASDPAAQAIQMLRDKLGSDLIFMNVSFVNSDSLDEKLEDLGESRDNVFSTQVVPLPGNTTDPLIAKYQAALAAVDSQAQPGFVSLEGYLAGRLAIYAVDACGESVTRKCFLNAVQTAGTIDLDGFEVTFGPTDNQGSDEVFLTRIDANGDYELVE